MANCEQVVAEGLKKQQPVEPMGVTQIITKERMKEEYRHELEELTLQFLIRETNVNT
ncbi:hypothetical protein [Aneurinibacillus aneurinilyticus]|jgi:hypothetical protein|uniref:hypothetical protein n=1 Tax=Aneurinibacillus aneurinilyticus TaxID=1391 RepID=UPI0023F9974F|nr:hypothetical protein [Aneurinibacillus aneurinilyticus]MCI1696867.1 hypothetical protein [Aneurinibacillus aneurinilyticus]